MRIKVEGSGLQGDLGKYLCREFCGKFVEIFVLGEICKAAWRGCLWRSLGFGDICRVVLKFFTISFLIMLITHNGFQDLSLVLNIVTINKLESKEPLQFVHTNIDYLHSKIGSYQSVNVYISTSRKYVCNSKLLYFLLLGTVSDQRNATK